VYRLATDAQLRGLSLRGHGG